MASSINVITSVYNGSRFLDEYIKSIEGQLLRGFNLTIVDALSTDDTLERLVKRSWRRDIKVKVIPSEKKIGLYEAWNIAIGESNTDWFVNLNVDDYLLPGALLGYEAHVKEIDYRVAAIIGNYLERDADMTDWEKYRVVAKNMVDDPVCLFESCTFGPFPLIRRDAWKELSGFNGKLLSSGDYDFWCRLVRAGYSAKKVTDVVGIYTRNPEGLSTKREKLDNARHEDLVCRHQLRKMLWLAIKHEIRTKLTNSVK